MSGRSFGEVQATFQRLTIPMYHVSWYNMSTASLRQLRHDFAARAKSDLGTRFSSIALMERINGARVLLSFDQGQRAAAVEIGWAVAP